LTSNKLEESILNVEIRIFEERKKERASRSVVDADIDTRGSVSSLSSRGTPTDRGMGLV
jgi:hypothetical protein